jgi:hypothetical protein
LPGEELDDENKLWTNNLFLVAPLGFGRLAKLEEEMPVRLLGSLISS